MCKQLGIELVYISIPSVLSAKVGESERKLHELVSNALSFRNLTLVFVDEIEALFYKCNESERLSLQFLQEMRRIADSTNVFIFAATNYPERLPKVYFGKGIYILFRSLREYFRFIKF